MPTAKIKYRLVPNAKREFQYWLICHDSSIRKFAKSIGVSHQYISNVLNGNRSITESVYNLFEKGGYSLPIEKVEANGED